MQGRETHCSRADTAAIGFVLAETRKSEVGVRRKLSKQMSELEYRHLVNRRCARGVPEFARELIAQVCSTYRMPVPTVSWRRTKDWRSSGVTHPVPRGKQAHIHVSAGTQEANAVYVVLHELAHYITRDPHTKNMYKFLFELFDGWLNTESFEEARRQEFAYKPRASRVGHRAWQSDRAQARPG